MARGCIMFVIFHRQSISHSSHVSRGARLATFEKAMNSISTTRHLVRCVLVYACLL